MPNRKSRVTLGEYPPVPWQDERIDLMSLGWLEVELHDHQVHSIGVVFGDATDGRLVITGLLIDPRVNVEITSRLLRDIPLGEIAALAALKERREGSPDARRSAASTPYRLRRVHPGAKGYPRQHFERIASEYRKALRQWPRNPVHRLAPELNCSEATLHRWLGRCRDMGLLAPRKTRRDAHKNRKERKR